MKQQLLYRKSNGRGEDIELPFSDMRSRAFVREKHPFLNKEEQQQPFSHLKSLRPHYAFTRSALLTFQQEGKLRPLILIHVRFDLSLQFASRNRCLVLCTMQMRLSSLPALFVPGEKKNYFQPRKEIVNDRDCSSLRRDSTGAG